MKVKMMDRSVSIEDVLGWKPCYPYNKREYLEGLTGGKDNLTVGEILELGIRSEFRLWVVLRPQVLPKDVIASLSCDFAEHVLPLYESVFPGDLRPREAIAAKRQWIAGEISVAKTFLTVIKTLKEAMESVKDAENAVRAVRANGTLDSVGNEVIAEQAVGAASKAVEMTVSAAWKVAEAAVCAAAWAAAPGVADTTEPSWQIEKVKSRLKEEDETVQPVRRTEQVGNVSLSSWKLLDL